ncbi:head-tail connector protein [Roseivivax sp. GX 12232]|uniref:head-tail connector protein n=1 Tax=Roseivivax sp. GX 12232 TaxID=2900547 RepID=UPI001E329734|nr:head-tail connector protein [Roseivivax sp. GX 12232]MCE0504370.1 head-tail connector protein [Roseivivax sp. GX 12232]
MMLTEETPVPEAALPVDALKRHLRMGSGFAEDDLQDAVLASFLRAALTAIEGRTARALIARRFLLTLSAWRRAEGQALGLAPVTAIESLTLIDRTGAAELVPATRYRLDRDGQGARVCPLGPELPAVPEGGSAELRFTAGYGADFDALPPDLAQAVLMLATHFYDHRTDTALPAGCMPFGVSSLLARYRPVRLGFSA